MAGAAALLAGGSHAVNAQPAADTLELDVAIDGRTWRANRLSEVGPPLMGDTFIVLGTIFAGGALDADVAGPDDPGAMGRWICQGTFLADVAESPPPHVFTTVMFALGDGLSSSAGSLETATDGLLTIGLEGGVEEVERTLSGGFGTYAGANGSVLQTHHSNNETHLAMRPGITPDAANYQFTFSFAG